MKYDLVLATVTAVCSLSGASIGHASLILGHHHAVEVAGQNKVPACRKATPDSNFYKIVTAIGSQCQSRVGANDLDLELIASHQPIKTEVQKKLLHYGYQLVNIICGDVLADLAYTSWAYMSVYDGDSRMFNDVTAKIQECYNAGKEFDGVDGIAAANTIHNCFRSLWIQDNEKVQSPTVQPVFTNDKSSINMYISELFKVKIGVL